MDTDKQEKMENVVKGLDGGKAGDNGKKPRKAIKRERESNQDIRICGVCRECFDGGSALGYHMRSHSNLKNAAKRYLQNQVDQILPDSSNSNMPAVSVDNGEDDDSAERNIKNQEDQILARRRRCANSNVPAVSVDNVDDGEHLTRGKSDTDHLLKTGKRSD